MTRNFENKGHKIVELDALVIANGRTPIARVAHAAIYEPTAAEGGIATKTARQRTRSEARPVQKNGVASLAYGDEAIQLRATRANQKRGARCELRAFFCVRAWHGAGISRFLAVTLNAFCAGQL